MNNNEYQRKTDRGHSSSIRHWNSTDFDSFDNLNEINSVSTDRQNFKERSSNHKNEFLNSYGSRNYPMQQQFRYNYNDRNKSNQYRKHPSQYENYQSNNYPNNTVVNRRHNQDYHGRTMPKVGATTAEIEEGYGEVVMCQYNATHIYDRRFIHSHEERCYDRFICNPEASLS
uniref:GATA zinc finger domain-containing protein 14-like n=1 Tax=Heterorhabditis bacteriophora TaxID=37862 RepID=A0A1I7WRR6_HETBA